jgi:hypothetical protein
VSVHPGQQQGEKKQKQRKGKPEIGFGFGSGLCGNFHGLAAVPAKPREKEERSVYQRERHQRGNAENQNRNIRVNHGNQCDSQQTRAINEKHFIDRSHASHQVLQLGAPSVFSL